MKKLILIVAVAILSMPLSFGQSKLRVDRDSFTKKIEKSDADIANAKRATNPNTWLDRGQLFYEAETAISNNIVSGMTEVTGNIVFGNPTAREEVVINNMPFTKVTYAPHLTMYADQNGQFRAWEVIYIIYEDAIGKSIEAYKKAYELGEGKKAVNDKVAEGLRNDYDVLYNYASNSFALGRYATAADFFAAAYDLSQTPGFSDPNISGEVTSALLYDTGMAYYFGGNHNKAIDYLMKAKDAGYENDGMVYQLLYHSYKGLAGAGDSGAMQKAKQIIEEGLGKYPHNPEIISAATDAYVALGETPESMIPVVEKAIADNPDNASLWNGLGIIYDGLKNYAKSGEAFEHVAQLVPNDAAAQFSAGYQYLLEGDAIKNKANADMSLNQEQLDVELARSRSFYQKGVPFLEKAHGIDPSDISYVELLKNVTFALREEPGMMELYEKYNALFNQMNVK